MRTISLIAFLLFAEVASAVDAPSYTTGPVRIIAPSPRGSPHWVADWLPPLLGQPAITSRSFAWRHVQNNP